MTWTYTSDPVNNQVDSIRLLLGDTDECDALLSDEEIQFYLNQWCDVNIAATQAALAIAAKFSRRVDESVGQVSVSYSQSAKQYFALAEQLKTRTSILAGPVICGGISRADKSKLESDGNRVQPAFTKGLHSNPRQDESNEDDL